MQDLTCAFPRIRQRREEVVSNPALGVGNSRRTFGRTSAQVQIKQIPQGVFGGNRCRPSVGSRYPLIEGAVRFGKPVGSLVIEVRQCPARQRSRSGVVPRQQTIRKTRPNLRRTNEQILRIEPRVTQ